METTTLNTFEISIPEKYVSAIRKLVKSMGGSITVRKEKKCGLDEAWEDVKKRSKNLNGRIMRLLPANTLQYVNLILIYCELYSSVKSRSIFLKGITPDYDKLFQTTFFKSLDFPHFIGNA